MSGFRTSEIRPFLRISASANYHNVWNPDDLSGFQTFAISYLSENRTLCPVFRCLLFPICLKSGQIVRFSDVCYFLSVWKPDVHVQISDVCNLSIYQRLKTGRYVRFSDVCYFLSVWKPDVMSGFQTSGLKLSSLKHLKHWNRTSDNRTILSGYQTLSEIRTISQPDTFRKRRNPDVRFSDVYCSCTKNDVSSFWQQLYSFFKTSV